MPVNTAVRAVVRSPGKAAPLGVLCLRVGAFTKNDVAMGSSEQWRALAPRARLYSSCAPHASVTKTIKCREGSYFQAAEALVPRTQPVYNFIQARLLSRRKTAYMHVLELCFADCRL